MPERKTDVSAEYRSEVESTIRRVVAMGYDTLDSVLPHIFGADVRLVSEIMDDLRKAGAITQSTDSSGISEAASRARRMSASALLESP